MLKRKISKEKNKVYESKYQKQNTKFRKKTELDKLGSF